MSFKVTLLLALVSILGYTSTSRAIPLVTNLVSNCDLSNVSMEAISQAGLPPPPAGSKLISLVLDVGTQNYTCNSSGTYTSTGAVATLVDASCISDFISRFQSPEFNLTTLDDSITPVEVILNKLRPFAVSGDHFFVADAPGTPPYSLSPVFDFRSGIENGNPEGFVIMNETQRIQPPLDPANNIDWLQLNAIPECEDGQFATTAYRLFTLGGQPPASCTAGTIPFTLSIPYAANYWFFK